MPITPYQQWCFQVFRASATRVSRKKPEFRLILQKASIDILPEAYLAFVWMTSLISVIIGVGLFITEFVIINILLGIGFFENILLTVIEILTLAYPAIAYYLMLASPGFLTKSRARRINAYLPYAANFVAAMSAANATPVNIFRSLALQGMVYGEVSTEAARIYRDTSVLGIDLISAIKKGVERSPSDRFSDLLQGIVSTLQSGGNLKTYFHNRAEQFMRENRADQREFLETLALMAESYVVVAVAMPIFLMIIMVIMYWVSGSGMNTSDIMLWLLIFVMLPAIHLFYIIGVKSMTPEV